MEKSISQKQLREFGILIGFGFPIILGWIIPAISGHDFRTWTLFIAAPALFLAIFKPKLLNFTYKFWMKLGLVLGWINSRLILGLVFFMVVFPTSLILMLFKYDPLRKSFNKKNSYKEYKKGNIVNLERIF